MGKGKIIRVTQPTPGGKHVVSIKEPFRLEGLRSTKTDAVRLAKAVQERHKRLGMDSTIDYA